MHARLRASLTPQTHITYQYPRKRALRALVRIKKNAHGGPAYAWNAIAVPPRSLAPENTNRGKTCKIMCFAFASGPPLFRLHASS